VFINFFNNTVDYNNNVCGTIHILRRKTTFNFYFRRQ